jgi:hypothetical protein
LEKVLKDKFNKLIAGKTIIHDGEQELINVWDTVTSNTVEHLLCLNHFKDNVKQKLTKLSITSDQKKLVSAPLFGARWCGGMVDQTKHYIKENLPAIYEYW